MPGYAGYKDQFVDGEANIWAPFASKLDWEMARWAKLRGPGSTALTELLKLDGVSFPFDLGKVTILTLIASGSSWTFI